MKIAINAVAALQGGGVTYLNQLLTIWAREKDLLIDVYGFKKADECLKSYSNIQLIDAPEEVYTSIRSRRKYEKHTLAKVIAENAYDIAFFPSGTITGKIKGKTKTVTMFRNMLPFSKHNIAKFSSFKAKLRYHVLRMLFLKSYKKADHVIFISEFAKNVIENHLPKISNKSSVIPHGINDQFRIEKEYQKNGYLLYVSIFNVYKHQKELVKGLAIFKDKNGWAPKLKLVGFVKEDYLEDLKLIIEKNDLKDEVELFGPASYDMLPGLYKNAKATVFASTCENCPNILLESMATNNAIICSEFQPMPEFLGEKGVYFNPEVPLSFASILEELIENDDKLKDLASYSLERSKLYTWEITAEKTLDVFRTLI